MKPHLIRFFLLLLLLVVQLPTQIVLADTGPKPTMDFAFKQNLPEAELQIISGVLYECDQPDCSDAAPLEKVGPQGLYCDRRGCRATAYGFAPYHKLEIEFSDEVTRQSNIFQTAGFNSKYTVTVRPDDLQVEAQFSPGILPPIFLITIIGICALIGIGIVAGLIIFLIQRSK